MQRNTANATVRKTNVINKRITATNDSNRVKLVELSTTKVVTMVDVVVVVEVVVVEVDSFKILFNTFSYDVYTNIFVIFLLLLFIIIIVIIVIIVTIFCNYKSLNLNKKSRSYNNN